MEQAAAGLVIGHENRLAHIEEKIDSLANRFEEVIMTQQKDHGKRLRDAETRIQQIFEERAREAGKREGANGVLLILGALLSSLGGIFGAVITKFI